MSDTMSTYNTTPPQAAASSNLRRQIPIMRLGLSLGLFISLTYILCVLFDLWLPSYAMNPAWSQFLPGFVWLSWTSFFIGLIETFAYGWYIALIFGPIYNFISRIGRA
ncbi:MAG: DUF5676 family membrane protein [Rhizobiaceae bacterium]|nr:DUF5676 family membrane protein [Rhizobiaceae bacterium]